MNVFMLKVTSLTILSCALFLACTSMPSMTHAGAQSDEYVVLLHGLARSKGSMEIMQKALIEKGYGTCNIEYPSRDHDIEALAQNYVLPRIRECLPDKDAKLSFVTHSMGGIIVRFLLQKDGVKNVNAVIMLSPPNQGSEVVDKLGDNWLFDWINGPAGNQLGTDDTSIPNQLGPANFKLGIITGNSTINPINSLLIPGPDDGKVSIERAKLSGMSDFLVVPVSHPFIMKNSEVIQQTLYFLENYSFQHNTEK